MSSVTKRFSGSGYGWVGLENMEAIWLQTCVAIEATPSETELEDIISNSITLLPSPHYMAFGSFIRVCIFLLFHSVHVSGPHKFEISFFWIILCHFKNIHNNHNIGSFYVPLENQRFWHCWLFDQRKNGTPNHHYMALFYKENRILFK